MPVQRKEGCVCVCVCVCMYVKCHCFMFLPSLLWDTLHTKTFWQALKEWTTYVASVINRAFPKSINNYIISLPFHCRTSRKNFMCIHRACHTCFPKFITTNIYDVLYRSNNPAREREREGERERERAETKHVVFFFKRTPIGLISTATALGRRDPMWQGVANPCH